MACCLYSYVAPLSTLEKPWSMWRLCLTDDEALACSVNDRPDGGLRLRSYCIACLLRPGMADGTEAVLERTLWPAHWRTAPNSCTTITPQRTKSLALPAVVLDRCGVGDWPCGQRRGRRHAGICLWVRGIFLYMPNQVFSWWARIRSASNGASAAPLQTPRRSSGRSSFLPKSDPLTV